MAIAIYASGYVDSGTTGNQGTYTVSFNVGTGSNRLLLASVSIADSASADISAISYNSVSMGTADVSQRNTNSDYSLSKIYHLVAPATGANTFSFTTSGNCDCSVVLIALTGVNQTTPIRNTQKATGNSGTLALTISSATNDLVIDNGTDYYTSGTTSTTGTGQSLILDHRCVSGSATGVEGATSQTPGGSVTTIGWTIANTRQWAYTAVSVEPAAAAGATNVVRNVRFF
jgi:hypothetical protein